jgi:hypothetical protein
MDLKSMLRDRIAAGLSRKSIQSCSAWATKYRVMGKPFPGAWNFAHHPWLRAMHDAKDELIVGQKSAQMGYTEVALNRSFYAIDVLGESVLYILPASTPDATDFSTSRFDPALELSPHLANLFSDVKNIGHKRAGSANLFIRGSRSRSQLKSLPVSTIIEDELDEMVQENVALAQERTSGQLTKSIYQISTPTIENYGINQSFRNSSQDHFFFPCPHCSRSIELTFPDCLVITTDDWTSDAIYGTHLICPACRHELAHDQKADYLSRADWVPTHKGKTARGFHINQLYSSTVRPFDIGIAWLKAQTNPSDEQEFYNSKLGLTHAVKGAKIDDAMLAKATGQHKNGAKARSGTLVTMGIDVGKWLHYEITENILVGVGHDINILSHARVVHHGKCLNFEELDLLMHQYGVNYCCIDANPERRKALEFAQRQFGRVKMVFYGVGINSKNISMHSDEECTITVDRTSWLDVSLGRFKNEKISLPIDVDLEYKNHLKALVRIYAKDQQGNPVGKYVCGNEDDHYAHARNYSEIALAMAAGLFQSQNTDSPL